MVEYFNCSNLTSKQFGQLAFARSITALVLLVFLIPIPLYMLCTCKKSLATVLQRIFFCLTLSTSFYLAVLSAHIEHYFNFVSPNNTLCKLVGFLDQYSGMVQLVYSLEIVLVLFHTIGKFYCRNNGCQFCDENSKKYMYFEACLYVIPWILPLSIAFIPFFRVPYGESGPWCWILSRNEDCTPTGYWEQMLMWYIPFGIAGGVSIICVVLSIVGLGVFSCQYMCQQKEEKRKTIEELNKFIGEFGLLIVFLLGYFCLFAVELGCYRETIDGDEYTKCMMAYSVSTPLSAIVIPLAFLIYLRYKFREKQKPELTQVIEQVLTDPFETNADHCLTRSNETTAGTNDEKKPLLGRTIQ